MDKTVNKNERILEYIFFIIVSGVYGFVNTRYEFKGTISSVMFLIEGLLFIGILYSIEKYKLKAFLEICTILVVALVTYLVTKETVYIVMLMVGIVSSRLEYRQIFKLIFAERLFIMLLIICSAFIGILPINRMAIVKGGVTGIVYGYGLGFNHPNQLAYNIGFLLLLYMCIRDERLRQRDLFGITTVMLFGYYITKTRTLILIVLFAIVLAELYLLKISRKAALFIAKKIAIWVMPICSLIAIGIPLIMDRATGKLQMVLYAINGVTSSRFTHASRVLKLYSIPWFGGISEFNLLQKTYGYSIVDDGYIRLLYNFGIIGFIIFLMLYEISAKRLAGKKKYVFLIAFFSIALWGITENILRSFVINFTVVFWAEILINKRESKK